MSLFLSILGPMFGTIIGLINSKHPDSNAAATKIVTELSDLAARINGGYEMTPADIDALQVQTASYLHMFDDGQNADKS